MQWAPNPTQAASADESIGALDGQRLGWQALLTALERCGASPAQAPVIRVCLRTLRSPSARVQGWLRLPFNLASLPLAWLLAELAMHLRRSFGEVAVG